ncbi:hypothetical protein D6D11_10779 [Aureobasidium pullulans]|nr:hypothetical protein D6D11_10779 [Aureobasidium pullulans]
MLRIRDSSGWHCTRSRLVGLLWVSLRFSDLSLFGSVWLSSPSSLQSRIPSPFLAATSSAKPPISRPAPFLPAGSPAISAVL